MNATTNPTQLSDPYLRHLSATHLKRGVYAVEDICTADGFIVLKAGQNLPEHIASFLSRHALRKPLQASVQVDTSLSASRIRDDVIKTIPARQMQSVYGRYDLVTDLERGIAIFSRHPLLTQQLTVLSVQLPHIYQQTLVVTWLSLVIGIKMKMDRAERSELVVGTLCHMIGMLHVSPEVASSKGRLSDAEQNEIQMYVERGIAALKSIPNFPAGPLAMVAEHRELPDGTGYPNHLEGEQLGLAGQIIGISQSAYSIYMKTLGPQGRSPRDLIPIIQINSAVYRRDVCAALLQLLREQSFPEVSLINDNNICSIVDQLLKDAAAIASCRTVVSATVQRLQADAPPQVIRVERIYAHLESILSSSGVLDPGHVAWMEQVAKLKYRQFYREIEDLDLMLGEVRWQIRRLGQLLRELSDGGGPLTAADADALWQGMKDLRGRH